MKYFSQLTFVIFVSHLIVSSPLLAKIEAPNYNFSLDSFKMFMPKSSFRPIQDKYKNVTTEKTDKGLTTYKVYIDQLRFKFPVFFQVREDKVTDFFARLPAYFLHDVFHQSIINRFGKQDKYFKKEEAAVYIWNKDKETHVYSGGCSITCFAIYYTVYSNDKDYIPLFKSMN